MNHSDSRGNRCVVMAVGSPGLFLGTAASMQPSTGAASTMNAAPAAFRLPAWSHGLQQMVLGWPVHCCALQPAHSK